MKLWRISNYADLKGLGGLLFPARWHSQGRPIVYAAEHPAGALVEFLVHATRDDLPDSFQLLTITCDAALALPQLETSQLGAAWTGELGVTRALGDRWLADQSSALLRVPSVILPDTWNVLINPLHADAQLLRISQRQQVPLDARLSAS